MLIAAALVPTGALAVIAVAGLAVALLSPRA
jgi:hypothetical protein